MQLLVCSDLLSAKDVEPDGMAILAIARAAAGGETWAGAETLVLSGHGRKAERPQITWPFGMTIFPEVFDIICSECLLTTSEYELCATALRFSAAPSFQPTAY